MKIKCLLVSFFTLSIFFSCSTDRAILKMPIRSYSIVNNVKDSVVYLPLLDIVNPNIYSLLDSIINLNKKCIHVSMGELTWFNIWGKNNDTVEIYIEANQYTNRTDRINKKSYGVFYYKNSLFVVNNSSGVLDSLFIQKEVKEKVITYYPNALNYLFKPSKNSYAYYQSSSLSSYYIQDQFIINNVQSSCIEYSPIYHKIRRGDTMEKICKLYWVKQEQIMKLNNLSEPILPGKGTIQIQ